MPDEVTNPTTTPDPAQQTFSDPMDFLAQFSGAPSKPQIELMKRQALNGKVKLVSPSIDGKRACILRGLSAREWEACQKEVPENTPQERYDIELQRVIVIKATLWASFGTGGKLLMDDLLNQGAGLCGSLYEKVCELSDFLPPQILNVLSIDL